MNHPNPALRRVGFIFFWIYIILGILLNLARSWPDLESTMYGFIKFGYPRLSTLSCPVLMTTLDRLPVTIRLHNSLNRPLSLYIDAQFSSFVLITNSEQSIVLQPGENRSFAWEVGKENIDLHSFIFGRVFTSASTSAGMREATCGTLVLNLPIKGGPMLFYACLVLTIIAGLCALWLMSRYNDKADPAAVSQGWWMFFLALVVAVGVVSGLVKFWFLGVITLILIMLTLSLGLMSHKI